jgi:hypothetical protein
MNKYARPFMGLCCSSILRGIRGGLRNGVRDFAAAGATASLHAERLPSRGLRSIPIVELDEILGSRKPSIRLNVQRYENGMLPAHEALVLLALLVAESPKTVLEIGTFMGHTTKAMAMNLPDSIIHTVDLPPDFSPEKDTASPIQKDDLHLIAGRTVGREFAGSPYSGAIRQHFADSALWDFSAAAGATFFFIDGSHTYEYCLSDSEKCFELCGGKGVFLWHDCGDGHPGVIKALLEWRARGRDIVRFKDTALAFWKAP